MSTTNTAISLVPRATVLPSTNDWNTMLNMADTLYRSGVLPVHIKNGAAVVAIMQKGKEVGVPPMHALQNIYFVKGKATLSAELMHALVIRDEGPGALKVIETDAKHCTVRYQRQDNEGTFSFTYQEAETAGLTNGPDSMYRKYPAAMLRSRCISACCRFVFPDIIGGMYTPEEMGATVDEDGDVLALPADPPMRATVAAQPPQPPQPPPSSLPVTRHPGKATAQPNGPDVQRQRLMDAAAKKGVLLHPDADTMAWADCLDGVFERLDMDFRTSASADGVPTARDIHAAILALPTPRAVDAETGEVLDGEAREEVPEMSEDDRALYAATDQGRLMPVDGGR